MPAEGFHPVRELTCITPGYPGSASWIDLARVILVSSGLLQLNFAEPSRKPILCGTKMINVATPPGTAPMPSRKPIPLRDATKVSSRFRG